MGKQYIEKSKLVENNKIYNIQEAIEILKKIGVAKFDETVDLAIRLGVDTKKSDQQVRGTLSLPHGLGKAIKIAVIAKGEKEREAKEAGATEVGAEDLIQKIEAGFLDFDVLIATPDMMSKVGKLGKILGRRGLMPSPKNGTVTVDVAKAVKEFQLGKIEFKADKFGIVNLPIGKLSFSAEKIMDNFMEVYKNIKRAKPSASKGVYLRSIALSPTMGPSVKVETVING